MIKSLKKWWRTRIIAQGNGGYDTRHMCRSSSSSVACYEVNGELWMKEFSTDRKSEGRTYEVSFCPFCGYQPGKLSGELIDERQR